MIQVRRRLGFTDDDTLLRQRVSDCACAQRLPALAHGFRCKCGDCRNPSGAASRCQDSFPSTGTPPHRAVGAARIAFDCDLQLELVGHLGVARERMTALGGGAPDGCLWYDLSFADGALNRGVWLPLGLYGVEVIPVSPTP